MPELETTCGMCLCKLLADAKFCHECGAKVPSRRLCLGCKEQLSLSAKFCPQCGTSAVQNVGKKDVAAAALSKEPGHLREELTDFLAQMSQEANIDSDGDFSCLFTTSRLPSFVKDFRASAMRYSVQVKAGEKTEDDISSFDFNANDTELNFRTPYCRVGKKQSFGYEVNLNVGFLATTRLEVHEITLAAGKLDIPKLDASSMSISNLNARKDDGDGSYGVEYEINAYPEHYIYFDVLTEKPDDNASVSGRFEVDATTSGTIWLYDVKPGQKIYLCLAEYKPIIRDVAATFTGTVESTSADDIDCSEEEPQSGAITRIKAIYCVNKGEYEFENESDRDEFLSNPKFNFDFNINNVDDKDGVERIFGTYEVSPLFAKTSPEFTVTLLQPSSADDAVAIVSVELEMFFDIAVSLENFLEWVEDEGETWRYSGRIECAGETGLLNSDREEYESYIEVTDTFVPQSEGAADAVIQTVKVHIHDASGLSIFISEDADGEMVNSLVSHLEDDGAKIISIKQGGSYMDFIAPLFEFEDGANVILDGVQHIEVDEQENFIRVLRDRVLVGIVGEGVDARSFELPMNNFNIIMIDRGGGETSMIKNAADFTLPDADEVAKPMLEVSLRDVEGDEYIYWVKTHRLPNGEDEVDWAIEQAKSYHAEHVGTEPAEEDEDDLPVTAYEPFDRSPDEYTLI